MAGSSLLALIDDIATVLDDVAVLSKAAAQKTALAAKKTAGVLGDDIALNAEQVAGVRADRELPVIWAVFKGSALNKLILVPSALVISAIIPWLITPLLILGGLYLCYEGFEKIFHALFHHDENQAHKEALTKALIDDVDMVAFEKQKIKGAIRTDFILSAEIIVIALGTVADATLLERSIVVTSIAALMTVGVYSFVAGVVKLDDLGLYLIKNNQSGIRNTFGRFILSFAPFLMKSLSVLGTAAMFLVGGGILTHGIPMLADWAHVIHDALPIGIVSMLGALIYDALAGIIAGAICLLLINVISKLKPSPADQSE